MALKHAVGGLVGAGIGYGLSWYSKLQAKAAVNVRPKLADVGFIDALLTNHGLDWIFYNEPFLGTAVLTIVGGAIGLFLFTDAGFLLLEFVDEVLE